MCNRCLTPSPFCAPCVGRGRQHPRMPSDLIRNDKKEWTWLKGNEAINQANVQSLLNTLTVLRAVRWAGATTPAHAFRSDPQRQEGVDVAEGQRSDQSGQCAIVA